MSGKKLYVHLPAYLDAETYRKRWEDGIEPDASPYGFHNAEELGYHITYSRVANGGAALPGKIGRLVKRGPFGLDLAHVWANRQALRDADVIWTMLEAEALAISMLMHLGLVQRKPLIAGTVWLMDRWHRTPWPRRAVFRRLLQSVSVVAVHAKPCLDVATKAVALTNARLMHFGVSSETFTRLPVNRGNASGAIVIYAIGNDQTRDWDVLLRAFGNDDRYLINFVCRWVSDDVAQQFSNVRLTRDPDMATMLQLYADADYAAVPMHPNRFSGITVALEAAALGVPILAANTGGLATYFSDDEMLLFEPGDDAGLKAAVQAQSRDSRRQMADRALTRFVASDYTTQGMMKRYDAYTRPFLAL